MNYEYFVTKKFYDESDSEDDDDPPTRTIVNVDPPIPPAPVNDPLYPRSPFQSVLNILRDPAPIVFDAICDTLCKGSRPSFCYALNPQCFIAPESSTEEPRWWMGGLNPFIPRKVMAANQTEIIRIYWLISTGVGRYDYPKFNTNGDKYDLHFKSTVGSLFPSISFVQDKAGSWLIPNQPNGWGTTTPSIDAVNSKIKLTDDHTSRVDDAVWYYQFEWISTGGQRIVYLLTKQYDPDVYIASFKTITLPSDCLLIHDKKNHAPTTQLTGALGGWHNGATEAFWDSNRAPPDQTVTIDLRDIPEWEPVNHWNVAVGIPSYGNVNDNTHNVSLTLTNNTDRSLNFFINTVSGVVGNATIASGETGTISGTFIQVLDADAPKYRRSVLDLSWFSNPPPVGFLSLTSFTTRLPTEITRKEYTPRDVIVRAYTLNTATNVLAIIDPATIFSSPSQNNYESSAFGNRAGFANKFVVLQCELWLHNWVHFGGTGVDTTTPPVNLAIDGSVRIASTLNGIRDQLIAPEQSQSYANPYDDDPAKNGVVCVGNFGVGAPSVVTNQKIVWYMSRDMTYDNTMRWSRVVTLN